MTEYSVTDVGTVAVQLYNMYSKQWNIDPIAYIDIGGEASKPEQQEWAIQTAATMLASAPLNEVQQLIRQHYTKYAGNVHNYKQLVESLVKHVEEKI